MLSHRENVRTSKFWGLIFVKKNSKLSHACVPLISARIFRASRGGSHDDYSLCMNTTEETSAQREVHVVFVHLVYGVVSLCRDALENALYRIPLHTPWHRSPLRPAPHSPPLPTSVNWFLTAIGLKVPKREIFDRSDFPDFYTIKSIREGDFGVKI